MSCDRCRYLADFLIQIVRRNGEETFTARWCWSCVSGNEDE